MCVLCTHQVKESSLILMLQRREREGRTPGDTDPDLDDLSDDEYKFVEEPPELTAARERLAAYTGRVNEEEPPGKDL